MDTEEHILNHYYVEGPHLLYQHEGWQSVSFPYLNNRWSVSLEPFLSFPGQIEVQRPLGNSLKIKVEDSISEERYHFDPAEKILVISDIEGNYMGLTSLLKGNSVINEEGDWIYGNNHLIMLGDIFDRGPDVTPCLWHLYKLEMEALQAGGRVHILLGNHEIMIFQGDLRYINRKYRTQYEHTGFQYDSLFSMETYFGQWLRNKPAMIRIGTHLFTHAGISPAVLSHQLGLEEMNTRVKKINLTSVALPVWNEPKTNILFGSQGPFWYRDWIHRPPSEMQLDRILAFYNVKKMIVGHTIVPKITSFYQSKLIAVDIKQPKHYRSGKFRALLIEQEKFYEVNDLGRKTSINYE